MFSHTLSYIFSTFSFLIAFILCFLRDAAPFNSKNIRTIISFLVVMKRRLKQRFVACLLGAPSTVFFYISESSISSKPQKGVSVEFSSYGIENRKIYNPVRLRCDIHVQTCFTGKSCGAVWEAFHGKHFLFFFYNHVCVQFLCGKKSTLAEETCFLYKVYTKR